MGVEETGYTLSPRDYEAAGRVVRESQRTPYPFTRHRRRQSVFQPSAGSRVYQCVSGLKLRAGTIADLEDTSKYEPVCLCVYLGTADQDDLRQFTNRAVFDLSQIVVSLGIVRSDNRIDIGAFEDNSQDEQILDITDGVGLTLLRTRACQGYIGTGMIVVGNQTEAWTCSGNDVFEATLSEAWIDGTDKAAAKLTFNQGAVDAGLVDDGQQVFDRIALKTPNNETVYFATDSVHLVEFNQQVQFLDDDAYADRYWFEHDTYGWLPIFNLANPPPTISVTNTSATTIPAYGVMLKTGITSNRTTVKRPDTFGSQTNALINGPNAIDSTEVANSSFHGDAQGGDGPFIAAYDSANTPAYGEIWGPRSGSYLLQKNTGGFLVLGIVDSTNHYVLVERVPFLRFRGVADSSIAADATGTVSIYYRSGATAFTDTTVNATALNDLDATVPSSAVIECVWEPYSSTEGWRIIQSDFSC